MQFSLLQGGHQDILCHVCGTAQITHASGQGSIQRGKTKWVHPGLQCASITVFLLQKVTEHKKPSGENKGDINHQDDRQADPHRLVHVEIVNIDERYKSERQDNEQHATDQFPFPGNDQEENQNIYRNQVDGKSL